MVRLLMMKMTDDFKRIVDEDIERCKVAIAKNLKKVIHFSLP